MRTSKMKHHKPCLILNADYTPISIVDWKTSISWYFKTKEENQSIIDVVKFYNSDKIIGCGKQYNIPSVIKLNRYIKMYKKQVKFCRKNLFIRDNNMCQYCGKREHFSKLTYDHVIPKSKWNFPHSATSWDNIVTACSVCNRKKGNKTPEQANMKLLNKPKQPLFNLKYLPWYQVLSNMEYISEWSLFIPKELVNESKCRIV